ncbi:hypothetical protein BJ165DRAFT_359195 [Panaeolus papilionaceus]|nr:hypothetical protein BJ165DRAFT_359195 [Panaeolus papilionaceus]
MKTSTVITCLFGISLSLSSRTIAATTPQPIASPAPDATKRFKVLILGGGVTGVIAARTLHQNGIEDYAIVEARSELGGRMQTKEFAGRIIEQGPNWIQGTQEGNGPANPIFTLANKHNISTQFNDWFGSVSTFDTSGSVDFLDVFNDSSDDFDTMTVLGGEFMIHSCTYSLERTDGVFFFF